MSTDNMTGEEASIRAQVVYSLRRAAETYALLSLSDEQPSTLVDRSDLYMRRADEFSASPPGSANRQ